jgi:threonine dehydrogenase-like Zn-dependent dehydrogenase
VNLEELEVVRIVFTDPGKVALGRHRRPALPAADEVLVRTRFSLVNAGAELAVLRAQRPESFPFVPGNRVVGEVLAVGAEIRHVRPGQVVFGHGLHESCTGVRHFVVPVPEDVPLPAAPLVGLGLIAIRAVRIAQPELGDRVAVFGLSPVGILCAQLFALAGARVVAVDARRPRCQAARRSGLAHVLEAAGEPAGTAARIAEWSPPEGVDIAVNATGDFAATAAICGAVRPGGQVVLMGAPRAGLQGDTAATLARVREAQQWRGLTLTAAFRWKGPLYDTPEGKHSVARDAGILFAGIAAGQLRGEAIAPSVVPATDAPRLYAELLRDPEAGSGVVFDWSA